MIFGEKQSDRPVDEWGRFTARYGSDERFRNGPSQFNISDPIK